MLLPIGTPEEVRAIAYGTADGDGDAALEAPCESVGSCVALTEYARVCAGLLLGVCGTLAEGVDDELGDCACVGDSELEPELEPEFEPEFEPVGDSVDVTVGLEVLLGETAWVTEVEMLGELVWEAL